MLKKIAALTLVLAFLSCDVILRRELENQLAIETTEEVVGEYISLPKEDIKVFLPNDFQLLDSAAIKAEHKKITNEKERYYFEKSYEQQLATPGNFYVFKNDSYGVEVNIQTLPYMPFGKSDARQLLYYIRKGHDKYQRITGIYHNKIKSTYSGDKAIQIFKAMYRMAPMQTEENMDDVPFEMFKTVYLISSKRKTISLNVITPYKVDFDPFVRKIKL